MLNPSTSGKIYVYTAATDMRKGVNGLSGMVRSELEADPTDGSLFVFINRRRDRMKMLYFDGGGFWLYYRLLEAGTFEELKSPASRAISPSTPRNCRCCFRAYRSWLPVDDENGIHEPSKLRKCHLLLSPEIFRHIFPRGRFGLARFGKSLR